MAGGASASPLVAGGASASPLVAGGAPASPLVAGGAPASPLVAGGASASPLVAGGDGSAWFAGCSAEGSVGSFSGSTQVLAAGADEGRSRSHPPHPREFLMTVVLAGTWIVDTAATTATFHAVGLGGAKVRGTIPVDAGRIEVGGSGRPLGVDVVLDAAGIDTGHARRDKDLRSRRFLKTDTYPVVRYTASSVTASDTGWTVDGVLTAAGAECPLTLDVRLTTGFPDGGECRVLATGTLDRRALGIKAPSFLVRRTVHLEIDAALHSA
jgi:polyisoprenoid-binding protein YceI